MSRSPRESEPSPRDASPRNTAPRRSATGPAPAGAPASGAPESGTPISDPAASGPTTSGPAAPEQTDEQPAVNGQGTRPNVEAAARVAELRVAGHLMTLDTGVFCVFPVPGSPPPDPVTGLPGVRVSQAPGVPANQGPVSISTFRTDGWLDGSAALVRIANGPAQILVTVYQAPGQPPGTAPRLQVMRLSADPAEAAAAPPLAGQPAAPLAAPAQPTATPEVVAHVQRSGDMGVAFGSWVGQRGSGQWIEGFGLAPGQGLAPEDIEYQGVLGRGWLSPWVEGGKFCGSRGMALPLLGLTVRLKGDAAKKYTCVYEAAFTDGSIAGPVQSGEVCSAESLAPLEAFQITLEPRAEPRGVPTRARAAPRGARR